MTEGYKTTPDVPVAVPSAKTQGFFQRFLRALVRAVMAILREMRGRDVELDPDLNRKGNVYGPLFDARIAALAAPQPVPPPDYSKQQLRGRAVISIGLVLIVIIGLTTALAVFQQRRSKQGEMDSTDLHSPAGPQADTDAARRKLLMELATKRQPIVRLHKPDHPADPKFVGPPKELRGSEAKPE